MNGEEVQVETVVVEEKKARRWIRFARGDDSAELLFPAPKCGSAMKDASLLDWKVR